MNQSYTVASGNLGFVGWAEVVNGVIDESTIYKNGDTIILSKPETVLEPVVKEVHWIIFNENDDTVDQQGNVISGGASFTPPAFYMTGENTVAPEDPERAGYSFAGWYTAAEGGRKRSSRPRAIPRSVSRSAKQLPASDTTASITTQPRG